MYNTVSILSNTYNIIDTIELTLEGKDLITVPDEIMHLKNLKKLNMSGNNLVKIPVWIKMLVMLEFIDISFNSLEMIPMEIIQLPRLKYLYVFNNPMSLIVPKYYQNNLPEMKYMIEDYIILNKVARSMAIAKIQAFLSIYMVPKYFTTNKTELVLSI